MPIAFYTQSCRKISWKWGSKFLLNIWIELLVKMWLVLDITLIQAFNLVQNLMAGLCRITVAIYDLGTWSHFSTALQSFTRRPIRTRPSWCLLSISRLISAISLWGRRCPTGHFCLKNRETDCSRSKSANTWLSIVANADLHYSCDGPSPHHSSITKLFLPCFHLLKCLSPWNSWNDLRYESLGYLKDFLLGIWPRSFRSLNGAPSDAIGACICMTSSTVA